MDALTNLALKFDDIVGSKITNVIKLIGSYASFDCIKLSRQIILLNVVLVPFLSCAIFKDGIISFVFASAINLYLSFSDIKYLHKIDAITEDNIVEFLTNRISSARMAVSSIIVSFPAMYGLDTVAYKEFSIIDTTIQSILVILFFIGIWVAYIVASNPPQKKSKEFKFFSNPNTQGAF